MTPSDGERISQRATDYVANPRHSLRWTLGSTLFMASFAAVMGPLTYFQHLVSGPRLPFTAAYFGSIALTLYFSIGVSVAMSLSSFYH